MSNLLGVNAAGENYASKTKYQLKRCLVEYKILIAKYIEQVKLATGDRGQTGWDPLGTFAIAESIQSVSQTAQNLTETLGDKVDDVSRITSEFTNVVSEAVQNLLPHIASSAQSVDRLSNVGLNLNFNFDAITKLFDNPISATIVAGIVYMFIEIIERKYEIPYMNYIKVLIASYAVFKVGKPILNLFSTWFQPPPVAQAEWTDWLSVGVQGLLFCVFGATVDTTTLMKSVNSLASAANNALKLNELFTAIVEWFKTLCDMVCKACNLETFEWLKPQDAKIKEFMTRVNELMLEYTRNPMTVGIEFAQEVTRLLMEINDYILKVPIDSKNQPVMNAVRDLQSKMQVLSKNVADAGMALGERNEPSLVILAGSPGVGKTYLTDLLCQDLVMSRANNEAEIIDAQRNWKQKVYIWPTENKHHDQYKGEMICAYPDLFCLTDAEGQPSEATSIVYLVGGQPIQLPAAEITKKQRLFFVSKILMACTNVTFIHQKMFKSLRNADAVKRRMNRFGFFVWVNPLYILRDEHGHPIVDPTTNKIRGYENELDMYGMLDTSLLPNLEDRQFPPDLWNFRKLDFSTGMFADDRIYHYDGYTRLMAEHVEHMERAGERKREQLRVRADLLMERRRNELIGQPQAGPVEFIRAEPRPAEPIKIPHKPDHVLYKDSMIRQDIKDELDELRLRQLHKQIIKEELAEAKKRALKKKAGSEESWEVTKEDDFHTSDEYEEDDVPELEPDEDIPKTVDGGQMDGREVRDLGDMFDDQNDPRRRTEIAQAHIRDRREIEEGEPDVFNMRRTVGWFNSAVMFKAADTNPIRPRCTWSHFFKAPVFEKVTEAEHRRVIEILTDTNMAMREMPILNELRGLALRIAREPGDLTPRRQLIFQHLRAGILQIDDELGPKWKCISTQHILEIAALPFEEVNSFYQKVKYQDYIYDPFMRHLHSASIYLQNMYETHMVPAQEWCMQKLRDIYFHPFFQIALEIAVTTLISSAIMMVILIPFQWWLDKIHKARLNDWKEAAKEHREAKIKMKTFNQSSWTSSENVKQTIDKHMDNFCGLYVVIHTEDGATATRHPCNMVFLGGKTAVIVDHARQGIMKIQEEMKKRPGCYVELVVVPFISTTLEKSTERMLLEEHEFETSEELAHYDLAIIKCKHWQNRPNIYHLIPPKECMEWMMSKSDLEGVFIERTTDTELAFKGPERRVDVRFKFGHSMNAYATDVKVFGESHRLSDYNYQSLIMRGRNEVFTTRAGYCTSPGFITDERKNHCVHFGWKQAQQPWLCYLHTSLRESNPNGAPIYKEMFAKQIEELEAAKVKVIPASVAIKENLDEFSKIIEEELELIDGGQHGTFELVVEREKIDENHISIASMDHKFFQPMKSEIKRSPLYGIDKRTRYPSRMGTVRLKDGTIVDTMRKAREDCGANSCLLNTPVIEEAIHQAMARVMTDSSVPIYRDILTFEQVVYGDSAHKLNSLNWNSSAGFYFRVLKDKYGMEWKGKRWMLDDEGKLLPKIENVLRRMYKYLEEKATRGERLYGINIDNIKDELLKKEKVLEANSRLFCTNDVVILMLSKSYMGSFAGWIFENRINNGIAIGVNPLGDEWDGIASHVVNNSPDLIFLDHKKFDKNQLRVIMKCVLVLMTMYYQDKGSVNERIREVLFEEIIQSIHVVMHNGKLTFYVWEQGNTSGNFLTAILNSLYNICCLYIICIFAWLEHLGIDPFLLKALPGNPADKALAYEVLGDDVILSVNQALMPGVNYQTITKAAKKHLNIIITDELKGSDDSDVPPFRTITEGSFLGRMFIPEVVNGVLTFLARLRRPSSTERVQWIKGAYDPAIEVAKVEETFLDMSYHPREDFEFVVSVYAPACFAAYGVYPRFTDYDLARRHVRTLAQYKYSFNDFVDGESFEGISIGSLLQKVAIRQNIARYESGVCAHTNAFEESDFGVKLTLKESGVEELSSHL